MHHNPYATRDYCGCCGLYHVIYQCPGPCETPEQYEARMRRARRAWDTKYQPATTTT